MRMQRLVFLLVMSFSAAIAGAESDGSTSAEVLADRLVALMHVTEVYAEMLPSCAGDEPALSADVAALFRAYPDEFGGVAPGSAHWREAADIYRRYRLAACSAISPAKVASIYAAGFARNTSVADLESAIAFYESPAGARLLAGSRETYRQVGSYLNSAVADGRKTASVAFRRDLNALVERMRKLHASAD